jgi:hypothetical protein
MVINYELHRRKADPTPVVTSVVWWPIFTETCYTEVFTLILEVIILMLNMRQWTSWILMFLTDKREPNGKLRLLYECAPLSFICERAGGLVRLNSHMRNIFLSLLSYTWIFTDTRWREALAKKIFWIFFPQTCINVFHCMLATSVTSRLPLSSFWASVTNKWIDYIYAS